ncbi:porin [Sulfurirhabdus autotrophica]|uniref:Phosphate-selective porin O/P n=1 Tax=Sulfurirhabdus autotrophica TaxID=1706046 RepID=A0A4R3YEP6_9PROT|nr:hypothetical protein [Sulfurirhabdus autotrophica]TCV90362.1 hypothetical protein EDC63_101332 [Sulfurirhabdus autotrophica]
MRKKMIALALTSAFFMEQAVAAQPTLEEKLEILQQEIEALKVQMNNNQVAQSKSSTISLASDMPGYDASATGGKRFDYGQSPTVIGGYGEAIYNNYRDSSVKDQADLRRFVLFFGHKFNDRLRFNSELEIEHSWIEGGEGGEVAMEQAYLEYAISDKINTRAGLMLMPIGITNETHEPPTFYGVERNQVESLIIPSTWRELGLSAQGEALPGLEYNVGISTSLNAGKFKKPENGLRESRTAGGEAAANDLGFFGALNYRGVPGLLVGGSVFSGNTGQDGASNAALKGVAARVTLWDLHANYTVGGLDLQALYARGTMNDADKVSAATGVVAPKSLYGWYTQAAYHVWKKGDFDVAPFIRYERYNTQASVADGYASDPLNNETVTTMGVNFKLHPQVVLKADIQNFKTDNKKDRYNLGIGYMF